MSKNTDAPTNETPETPVVEGFVVKVPRFNLKTMKIVAASFAAGAAVASLVIEVTRGSFADDADALVLEASPESTDTQD